MSFGGLLATALGGSLMDTAKMHRENEAKERMTIAAESRAMDTYRGKKDIDLEYAEETKLKEYELANTQLEKDRTRVMTMLGEAPTEVRNSPTRLINWLAERGETDMAKNLATVLDFTTRAEANQSRASLYSAQSRVAGMPRTAGAAPAQVGQSNFEIEKEFEDQVKEMDRRDMDDETLQRAYDLYRQGVDPRSGSRTLTVREALVEAAKGTSGVASTGFHPDMAGGDPRAMLRETTRLGEGGRMLNSADARNMSPDDIRAYVASRAGKLPPGEMDGSTNPAALETGLLASLTNTPINEMQGLLGRPAPAPAPAPAPPAAGVTSGDIPRQDPLAHLSGQGMRSQAARQEEEKLTREKERILRTNPQAGRARLAEIEDLLERLRTGEF